MWYILSFVEKPILENLVNSFILFHFLFFLDTYLMKSKGGEKGKYGNIEGEKMGCWGKRKLRDCICLLETKCC